MSQNESNRTLTSEEGDILSSGDFKNSNDTRNDIESDETNDAEKFDFERDNEDTYETEEIEKEVESLETASHPSVTPTIGEMIR